jgi:hypothetical protein
MPRASQVAHIPGRKHAYRGPVFAMEWRLYPWRCDVAQSLLERLRQAPGVRDLVG